MPTTFRAFIAVAVDCPPPLAAILRRLERLGREVRAVSPGMLHVTLKFLGELPWEQMAPVAAALADVAAETRGGTLALRGLGAFPTAERARVVWAGLADAEELIEAAANCERRIAPLGFPTEARGFTPHVTLARIPGRTPAAVADLLAEHPASDFGTTPFAAIELFQSEPTPRGPRYVSLSRTPVTG